MRKIRLAVLAVVALSLSACGQADPWDQGFANKICPVQGGEIDTENPALAVQYQGQRIGFCCPGCPQEFRGDPERYMDEMRKDPAQYGYRG
jgi:YHS domain-containing protein